MKLNTLAAAFAGLLALAGTAPAQQILPDGRYVPAPQNGTVIQPATYTTPQMMNGTVIQPMSYTSPQMMNGTTTYTMPDGTTTGGMTYGSSQYFPSSMPGATIVNGTTTAVRNVGTTVVTGTRRTIRRGLGIFRR